MANLMNSVTIEVIDEGNDQFTIIKKANGRPFDVIGPQKWWDLSLSDQSFIEDALAIGDSGEEATSGEDVSRIMRELGK